MGSSTPISFAANVLTSPINGTLINSVSFRVGELVGLHRLPVQSSTSILMKVLACSVTTFSPTVHLMISTLSNGNQSHENWDNHTIPECCYLVSQLLNLK